MSDEQEVKEKPQNKLIFVNCVDGFIGQNLAKYLSRCVVGASAAELEEEEEDEEGQEEKELVEPPADQVYHVIGSLKEKMKPKPSFVQDVVLFDNKEMLYTYLFACDIIIYDISEFPDQAEEAAWVATQLASDMEKIDKSKPKTFILISSILSWARTKSSDAEDADLPLTEDDYRRRKGHPTYKDQLNAEKAVLKLGQISRAKLAMYVVTTGLTYGADEGIFHYLFKAGWHNVPDLPCLGDGRNVLPTIHIRDLAAVVQNLADNRPKSKFIVAVDDSNNTLREITRAVSKSLTTGKVRNLREEEALLDRDRKQSDFDQLTVNLHLDPVSVKDMNIRWSAEGGLVENIERIVREYRASRQLVPVKVLLLGPPASGKSTVAQHLCQLYKLHHVRIKDVIEEAIGKMHRSVNAQVERKDDDAKDEAEDEEEMVDEEEDEDRDQPGDYESLLEAIKESREQNNGKIEDSLVIPMFREKLRLKPCQNQGFILDGYPKTIEQAKELFASEDVEGEGAGGRGAQDTLILPDLVVVFEATDDFLRQRVLNLPENVVMGTHYTEHGMAHCVGEYRALNAEGEETVVSFFEELEIPLEIIDITKDSSVKMKDTVEKIKKLMGKARNYGMTSEEEEETRLGDMEARSRRELGEKAEREKLEAEESVNRKRRQDEWAKRLEEVKSEEQQLLEAKTTPLRNYLMKHVMPTLTRALIDCVKVRPEDAVDFIAEYMFTHNPQVD